MRRYKVIFLILLITLLQSCTICRITTHSAFNATNKKELTVRDRPLIEIYIQDDVYYAGIPVQCTKAPTPIIRISKGQWPLACGWSCYPPNRREQSSESGYVYFPLDKEQVATWNKEHGTNYKFIRFTPNIFTEQTFNKKGAQLVGKDKRLPSFLPVLMAHGEAELLKNRNDCVKSILSAPLYIVDVAFTIPVNILVWICYDIPYNVYHTIE